MQEPDLILQLKKAKILREMGDLSASIQIAEEVTQIAEEENNLSICIDALLTKIYCLWQLYDNETGLSLCNKVEKKLESITKNDTYLIQRGTLRQLQGNLYGSIANYIKAIEFYAEGLEIFKKLGNRSKIAQLLINLGSITSLVEDTAKAKKLLKRALDMAKEDGNLQSIAWAMNNLGSLYLQTGYYDKSLEYHEKSLEMLEKIGNPIDISSSYLKLINFFLTQDERDKALEYYGKLNILAQDHEHEIIKLRIKLCHAILLKGEKRFRSKVEAVFIFEEILNEKALHEMYSPAVLKHLAEIKLEELEYFEDEGIIEEIEDIVLQLQQIGRRSNSILTVLQADLLLSKIYLIRGEPVEAKNLIKTAKNSAETHGLTYLVSIISNFYNQVLDQMHYWEKVDSREITYKERINRAEIFNFLRNLQNNKLSV